MSVRMEPAVLDSEPAWGIANLFPAQGFWANEDYLFLPGNHLVELTNGTVDGVAMPTTSHQPLLGWLYLSLHRCVQETNIGVALVAPLPVRLSPGVFREPDLLPMFNCNRHRIRQRDWDGADLVMEVISPDDPLHDLETKRREYAQAGIPEYWLIDPLDETITVFTLPESASTYDVHGVYDHNSVAESVLLPGFTVDVDAWFAEGEQP